MAHNHSHDEHTHNLNFNKAFKWGIALNLLYIIIEMVFGYRVHSIALISDGIHNLSDVFGMCLSWGAFLLLSLKPTKNFTYGFGRATILAAYMNALILFIAIGALAWETIQRLSHPVIVEGGTVAIVSGVGIIINALTALLFFKDRNHDINMKATYLHMAIDALTSASVLVSGIIISYTGWNILDPIVSLTLLVVVILGTWRLMRESVLQILDSVPKNINLKDIKEFLLTFEGVSALHNLHIWNLTTTETAMTTHLIIKEKYNSNQLLDTIQTEIKQKFNIKQITIQVEYGTNLLDCEE